MSVNIREFPCRAAAEPCRGQQVASLENPTVSAQVPERPSLESPAGLNIKSPSSLSGSRPMAIFGHPTGLAQVPEVTSLESPEGIEQVPQSPSGSLPMAISGYPSGFIKVTSMKCFVPPIRSKLDHTEGPQWVAPVVQGTPRLGCDGAQPVQVVGNAQQDRIRV